MAMASFSFLPPSVTAGSATAANVFEMGSFNAVMEKVESGFCGGGRFAPPKPVVIGRPSDGGEFPVLLLIHGYLLYNTFYSQLIQHIASHGFIVVAPQLYTVAGPDSSGEIKATAAIADWLPEGLRQHLPPNVNPNLDKLALAGHSRGGKTSFAFALALNKSITTALKFSALIGLDPVDGTGSGKQTHPPVLKFVPQSFDFGLALPVLVIGSGLGEVKRNPLFPPCAPKGLNHEDFFNECRNPAHYLVVKDYGHLDLLDDETGGIRGKASYCLCRNGESRGPMRRFVGGAVVAFLKAYLDGEEGDLAAIEDGSRSLPLDLQTVKSLL
ncbi:chlorophyllase-2, chloroplastic-like [Momordica charantia]|uniref:Chlorophyllase-2, chloroplastic-like n=1 Tax=Momordica charantia TaxID=3673 RepID=A0A6J1C9F9_MOMCH|nr:chlorophyllase-2, chloroplastic-like [Momordica charantia]